eukprot:1154418-Pelagomonas_calceolata.AAC.2
MMSLAKKLQCPCQWCRPFAARTGDAFAASMEASKHCTAHKQHSLSAQKAAHAGAAAATATEQRRQKGAAGMRACVGVVSGMVAETAADATVAVFAANAANVADAVVVVAAMLQLAHDAAALAAAVIYAVVVVAARLQLAHDATALAAAVIYAAKLPAMGQDACGSTACQAVMSRGPVTGKAVMAAQLCLSGVYSVLHAVRAAAHSAAGQAAVTRESPSSCPCCLGAVQLEGHTISVCLTHLTHRSLRPQQLAAASRP